MGHRIYPADVTDSFRPVLAQKVSDPDALRLLDVIIRASIEKGRWEKVDVFDMIHWLESQHEVRMLTIEMIRKLHDVSTLGFLREERDQLNVYHLYWTPTELLTDIAAECAGLL